MFFLCKFVSFFDIFCVMLSSVLSAELHGKQECVTLISQCAPWCPGHSAEMTAGTQDQDPPDILQQDSFYNLIWPRNWVCCGF